MSTKGRWYRCKLTHYTATFLNPFGQLQFHLRSDTRNTHADSPLARLELSAVPHVSCQVNAVLREVHFIQTPPLARRCQLHQAPIFKHLHLANRIRVAERDHGPFLHELVHQSAHWLAHPRKWQLFQFNQPLLSYMYEASCK